MLTRSTSSIDPSTCFDTGGREPWAAEIVDRLGAPLFMDSAPGAVLARCLGYVGNGTDRNSALRALAEQIEGESSR